jgi:hypothetical protein
MTRRQKGWALTVLSGGCGWYLTLVAFKVLPHSGPWWVQSILGLAAIVAWSCSLPVVNEDMDMIIKRLAATEHFTPLYMLRHREERLGKWLMVPLVIWWLPLLLMFAGGMSHE